MSKGGVQTVLHRSGPCEVGSQPQNAKNLRSTWSICKLVALTGLSLVWTIGLSANKYLVLGCLKVSKSSAIKIKNQNTRGQRHQFNIIWTASALAKRDISISLKANEKMKGWPSVKYVFQVIEMPKQLLRSTKLSNNPFRKLMVIKYFIAIAVPIQPAIPCWQCILHLVHYIEKKLSVHLCQQSLGIQTPKFESLLGMVADRRLVAQWQRGTCHWDRC